ncbi:MAG: Coenzyme F420 hydrogenase/dehydrogenase, beta subunit C-terminal domain [Deltaproteobacteria bacterium]|nr:Coenzyme F420 hydrogenase/dehydrogenase, beta subunit C-terminal domain [Deltaproteobacteria bacterium]
MGIKGSRELVQNVLQAGMCIGCGACVELCPYFRHYKGRTLQVFPCDLESGRCFAFCPKIEVDLDALSRRLRGCAYEGLDLGVYRSIRAARAGAALPKASFQGGGTVSALMAFALGSGVTDAAVLTDREGAWPLPRIVTDAQDVLACASSKFTAAPTLQALNRAVRLGHQRLGMVGTPCQVTAAAQMKGGLASQEDFRDPVALTVGLFCNWALDPRALNAFLGERVDLDRVTGMDIPPPPAEVLVVRLGEESREISLQEVRPLIPETCRLCPDLTSEWADLSVGMFEGRPGWNTLIVRTDRGGDLVRAAEEAGYLELEPMPEENTAHLAEAGRTKKERAFRTALRENAVNRENGCSVLRLPAEVVDRLT